MKTNACRILDRAGIDYSIKEYQWKESEIDAVSVARKIGMPPEEVFKTLVLRGTTAPHFVVVLPGDRELHLKQAARETGNKSCSMLPLKELQALTGYIRGGCSPIGMKKALPTFIDVRALAYSHICISAGVRGAQILLAPNDLAAVTHAHFGDLCA